MKDKLLSVCVPIYNVEKYLKQNLESLFQQTISNNIEYIFVNDCSTDDSLNIFYKYCSLYKNLDINLINHETNRGLGSARKTAFEAVSTPYFICIDSDDYIEKDYIEEIYSKAIEEKADICIVLPTNSSYPEKEVFSNNELCKQVFTNELPCTVWCKMFRTGFLRKHDINWIDNINIGEDVLISIKALFFSKKTVFLKNDGYKYRPNIGFSNYMKTKKVLQCRRIQYEHLELFFKKTNASNELSNLIELKKAEIRYDYIKNEKCFSLTKYTSFLPNVELKHLYIFRKDYNTPKVKFFIFLIDKHLYIFANLICLFYKITSK